MKRQKSANLIQNYWKSHKSRKQQIKKQHNTNSNNNNVIESVKNGHDQNLNLLWHHSRRPKPISGTPPPLDVASGDKCDFKTIQQTCSLFGLDLVSFNPQKGTLKAAQASTFAPVALLFRASKTNAC